MKRLIITIIVRLKILSLWRYWNRKSITILMVHGVVDQHTSASWAPLWVRPTLEKFELSIKQISKYYNFISLDDAVRILDGSSPPVENAVVLTFDDGYRNNFSEALPLLEQLGIPATFFVATGYVETGRSYWIDRLDYALQQAPDESRLLRYQGHEYDLRNLGREQLINGYRELRLNIKRNEQDDEGMIRALDEFCGALESSSGVTIDTIINTDPFVSIASWAEQSAACKGGATIGSHSVDHCRLTSIPKSDIDEQLIDSKDEIEEKLGNCCQFFCYPNGSFNEDVLERVRKTGYRAAVTTVRGLNRVGDDLYALKRFAMPMLENEQDILLGISGVLESRLVRAILKA